MLIADEYVMEKIVSSREDLEWEGWDVVRYTKNPSGYSSVDGAFKSGQWYKKTVFPITTEGWNIPNSIARAEEYVEG